MRILVWIGLVVFGIVAGRAAFADDVHQFTVVNIEFEGTKVWVPGTLVVHKGDTVKVKLINNVKSDPNQHGYAIAAFNVAAVVNRGEPQDVDLRPRGTLVIIALFAALFALTWLGTYVFVFLQRGAPRP